MASVSQRGMTSAAPLPCSGQIAGSGNGDAQGHGTHCAGTIFGRDVDNTRIGVARGVNKALIGKVLGDDGRGSSEMIFRGIQWALAERAQVISMSLGFDFPGAVRRMQEAGLPVEPAVSNALEANPCPDAIGTAVRMLRNAHQ